MTVLNDKAIKSLFSNGEKPVEPFDSECLQPASIDLKLGTLCYKYNIDSYMLGDCIDEEFVEKKEFETIDINNGESAFIGIYEKISIPKNTIGIIFPRSSITRLGIHIITTYMNPGYEGYLPLTIINHSGIKVTLKPMCRVAQLVLFSLAEQPEINYRDKDGSKYCNECVDYSKIYKDKDIEKLMEEILEKETPILNRMMKKER